MPEVGTYFQLDKDTNGSTQILRQRLGVISFRAEYTGTVRRIDVEQLGIITGFNSFAVRINNVMVISNFADMHRCSVGSPRDSRTGLSKPIVRGQIVTVDWVLSNFGRLILPLSINLVTEVGE